VRQRVSCGSTNPVNVRYHRHRHHHLVRCQDRLRRHLEQGLSSPSHIILNLDTLAAAHAEAGRFDDTIKTQQRTIDRTKSEKWDGILFGQRVF